MIFFAPLSTKVVPEGPSGRTSTLHHYELNDEMSVLVLSFLIFSKQWIIFITQDSSEE